MFSISNTVHIISDGPPPLGRGQPCHNMSHYCISICNPSFSIKFPNCSKANGPSCHLLCSRPSFWLQIGILAGRNHLSVLTYLWQHTACFAMHLLPFPQHWHYCMFLSTLNTFNTVFWYVTYTMKKTEQQDLERIKVLLVPDGTAHYKNLYPMVLTRLIFPLSTWLIL